jgi:3',5'-cyclic-AMP phosphodiesterase
MDFSFVQITDHHLTESESELLHGFSPGYAFRMVLRHIAQNVGEQADFILSTGDLVDIPSEASYKAFLSEFHARNSTSKMPGPLFISSEGLHDFPMYFLPGNHDDRDNFFKLLFPKSSHRSLMNVTFEHKGVQFICLDWGPHAKATTHPELLDFLARALEKDLPAIIVMHHQLVPIGSRWLDSFISDDLSRFWEIVTGRNVIAVFSGHVHTTYERVVNAIPIYGLRSTAFPFVLMDEPLASLAPPHYRLVTVRDGVLSTRIFEVPL